MSGDLLSMELREGPRVERLGALLAALAGTASANVPAGLAVAIVDADGPILTAHRGWACLVDARVPVQRTTLFDLASLTKVVATTTLAVAFEERGRWALDDTVTRWVPDFPASDTRLHHLLTHTSGLIAHRPYFETLQGRRQVRAAVCRDGPNTAPGKAVVYSDLNFMLLGWALEKAGGDRIDRLFLTEVAAPLGMAATRYRPPARLRQSTAATEAGGDQRREPMLVWGSVHDGNTWALGGVSGHAGLFAPLDDLVRFTRALLDPASHPVLSASSIERMTARHAGAGADIRGLGWRLAPTEWGRWSNRSFWHTGFTGTSILVDPVRGIGVVMLTNAIHPERRLAERDAFHALVHTTIAEAWR
jgi:CubicO group peptidase (beta-lactamase class C family)